MARIEGEEGGGMQAIPKLFDDPRPIKSIWFNWSTGSGLHRAANIRIDCYTERDGSIWFAIYRDNYLFLRVNSAHVQAIEHKEAALMSKAETCADCVY